MNKINSSVVVEFINKLRTVSNELINKLGTVSNFLDRGSVNDIRNIMETEIVNLPIRGVVYHKPKFEFGKDEVEFKIWFMNLIDSAYKYDEYTYKERMQSTWNSLCIAYTKVSVENQ